MTNKIDSVVYTDDEFITEKLDSMLFEENDDQNVNNEHLCCSENVNPEVLKLFSKSYLITKSKSCHNKVNVLELIGSDLCYKGDVSKGFFINEALNMPVKDAIAYAFYFATLKVRQNDPLHADFEAARDFIIRTIQRTDIDAEDRDRAKHAFYCFFQGYIDMIVRKFYSFIQHSGVREEAIDEGISYVWDYIYSKKLSKYDGRVSVTCYFGRFIASWLEEFNAAQENSSRSEYRQARSVRKACEKLREELKREPSLSEVMQETELGITQVQKALAMIEYLDNECLLSNLEAPDNMPFEDLAKDELSDMCSNPENTIVEKEQMGLMYRALNSITTKERDIYLACYGTEIYEGHIEWIDIESDKKVTDPTKQFNKVAKRFGITAKEVEQTFQRVQRKMEDFCEIRKHIKNEYITNQDAYLSFNKKEDDLWITEFLNITGFKPD